MAFLLIVILSSLCIRTNSFLSTVYPKQQCIQKRVPATNKDNGDSNEERAPPFLAPWVNDAGAFARAISKAESAISSIRNAAENFDGGDSKDATSAEDQNDNEKANGSIVERVGDVVRNDSANDETLLEPYSDGIQKEIEEVVLSDKNTASSKTQEESEDNDKQKVVQGPPSSLLGKVLGDDDASVSIPCNENEDHDDTQEAPESDDKQKVVQGGPSSLLGEVLGDDVASVSTARNENEDHDDNESSDDTTSETDGENAERSEDESPTIQERIVQVVTGQDANDDDSLKTTASSDGLLSLARDFKDLVFGGDEGESVLDSLLQNARVSAGRSSFEDDERSYEDLLGVINEHRESIGATIRESFSPVDFSKLLPTSLFYYLEFEDSRKNPSWKRRMHRFHPSVDIEKVGELNEQLYLAQQSYCDTVEEVREGLERAQEPVELVFCDTKSFPGRPAHFIAVNKEQSQENDYLEVVMVVRGTKSIMDIITDGLLVPEDYRGGKVHAGFRKSGQYLVETHIELLRKLCKMANKERLKVTLIGHSLGAGACAIAAMEFNEMDGVDAQAIGFGSPSLLSEDLAEGTKGYITTVISDDDIVPRLNDVTVANTILDLMEHDWTPLARRDIEHAFRELQRRQPGLMTETTLDDAMALVDAGIERFAKPKIRERTTDRLSPVLFPPGTCIHFYRDGAGVSATYSPCTFFDELIISRTCVRDHLMIGGYSQIFLNVMREQGNPHFTFENCLLE